MPASLQLASAAILLISAIEPLFGLLFLAIVMPLGTYVWAFVRPPFESAAVVEILLTPFLLSAGLRLSLDRRSPPSRIGAAGAVLAAVVAASAAVQLAIEQQATTWPDMFLSGLWQYLAKRYFADSGSFISLHTAAAWIEGIALALCAETILRTSDLGRRLAAPLLLTGATAAAATTWVRFVQISLRREHPLSAAIGFLHSPRINTLYTDVNAAGSLFAMYFAAALWLALRGGSILDARWRLSWYWLSVATISLALWLTHSRAAIVAPFVSVGLLWLVTHRPSGRTLAIGGVAAAVLLAGLVIFSPTETTQSSSSESLGVRLHMAGIALRMTQQHPLFGIGLDQFRRVSQYFITPDFIARFPQSAVGENAHNNFLQILAELGIIGLAAFGWLFVPLTRSIGRGDVRFMALTGGVFAFLLTCLLGHPFLIVQVLWLFMLMVGCSTGLIMPATAVPRLQSWIAALLVFAVLVSVPVRVWAVRRTADLTHVVIGAGPLSDKDDSIVYRLADQRSRWFVSSRVRHIEIPLRLTGDSSGPCHVDVRIDGQPANAATPGSSDWISVVIDIQPTSRDAASRQLDLLVSGSKCQLKVGQFATRE
jgi:O-antigen ligase